MAVDRGIEPNWLCPQPQGYYTFQTQQRNRGPRDAGKCRRQTGKLLLPQRSAAARSRGGVGARSRLTRPGGAGGRRASNCNRTAPFFVRRDQTQTPDCDRHLPSSLSPLSPLPLSLLSLALFLSGYGGSPSPAPSPFQTLTPLFASPILLSSFPSLTPFQSSLALSLFPSRSHLSQAQ